MIEHLPRLRVGMVIASVLVGASVFGAPANATQPECQVVNMPPKKALYNSNEYANPLGSAIAEATAGDTLQVIGTCYGNFVVTKDLTITGRKSDQHADTIDGDVSGGAVLSVPYGARQAQRRRADSNRCTRLCRPLPNHSATAPRGSS